MRKVEILSVGTELLMGQVANTNAQYISKRAPESGMAVYYHSVVGDNPERLKESLRLAMSRADVIFTTGGLGPTQDDLTKQTIADAFGLPLVIDEASERALRKYFTDSHREMSENNLRQVCFPKGAIILDNIAGTAPGCIVSSGKKIVIMFPGPPKELIPMYDRHIPKYFAELNRKEGQAPLYSKFLRVVGVCESQIEVKLLGLIEGQSNPTLATYAKDGNTCIRVTAHDENGVSGETLVGEMTDKIVEILGNNVYSFENEELEDKVLSILKERGQTVSVCEIGTAGMLGHILGGAALGESVYRGGVVFTNPGEVYGMLGETVDKVSENTAKVLATRARKLFNTDIGLSICGSFQNDEHGCPAQDRGHAFICVKYKDKLQTLECNFAGSVDFMKHLACVKVLDLLRRGLIND